jgi:uncharacterized protein (TIGR02246 family)
MNATVARSSSSKLPIAAALVLSLALAGCDRDGDHRGKGRHHRGDNAKAAEEIRQTEAGMLAAWKARDAAKAASYYAEDARFVAPGQAPAAGRAAAQAAFETYVKDSNFSIDFTNEKTDVARSGELAWTRGSYRLTYTDPKTRAKASEAGSYATVFRRGKDGSWKAVEDIASPGAAVESPTLPLPPPKGDASGGVNGGG